MDPLFSDLLAEAVIDKKSNELFLKQISTQKEENILPLISDIHHRVFSETDCLTCANCCKTTPPLVIQEDVFRISRYLGISAKNFIKTFVIVDFNGEMILKNVPCTFLNNQNACTIYEVRPEACRRYPHTNEKGYAKRKSLNLANTLICPAALKILRELKKALPLTS
ncbi:MAG: YkgJ family cysteine cluster protein [Saprospiraceae bacterium]|jgi:Fe-S-cluster containining protein|nr:YkgJ family cysteine cluster protein [Saprospiraceae bacterium]MBL0025566.1 YkgJ family cysteine cluster protein [Saprospiraceae bacterium]